MIFFWHSFTYAKENKDYSNIEYYLQFLEKHIDSIPDISTFKKHIDVVYGDEGLSWKSLYYTDGSQNVVIMETNWVDTAHISRIIVCSDKIRVGNIHVGTSVKEIKNTPRYSVEPCQDGYLLLKDNSNNKIFFEVDISTVSPTSPLWYGECSVNEIPDTLCIKSIILSIEDNK